MDITLERRAIVLRLNNDSVNLKPLLYYIENSFSDVKEFSNTIIIQSKDKETIKTRYLLRWAYKIYSQKKNILQSVNYKQLSESIHLPIHVICTDKQLATQKVTITIEHMTSHELSINCSKYNTKVFQHLKTIFQDSMVRTSFLRTFKLSIKTKNDLLILKNLLSRRHIEDVEVMFVTHGLNFKKIYTQDNNSEERAYKEKLKKSYKILSITTTSTTKEIKNNYKKMLRKYHPDRVYAQSRDIVELYTRRFQVIQEAYELVQEHHSVA